MKRAIIIEVISSMTAAFAVYTCCYLPLRASLLIKRIEASTAAAWDSGSSASYINVLRENVETLERLMDELPGNVELYMLAAANYRLLGRYDSAVAMYERALELDRRPEIYFNLAVVQAQTERRSSAAENFARAVAFDPALLSDVTPISVRSDVYRALEKQIRRGVNLLANPSFEQVGPEGSTVLLAKRGSAPSAAAGWSAYVPNSGFVKTTMLRDGLIRVETVGKNNGLIQGWKAGVGPANVRCRARVLVEDGQIAIGAGAASRAYRDVSTKKRGVSETLDVNNGSCPARAFTIVATSDRASFLIDEAAVIPVDGAPCDPATGRFLSHTPLGKP